MSSTPATIAASEALSLHALVTSQPQGVASRVLAKASGGSLTLFAFDAGQRLSEHTSPYEALVVVQDGSLTLTIGGTPVVAAPGTIVRMPARVPHAVEAAVPSRMLLVMLRDSAGEDVHRKIESTGEGVCDEASAS